MRKYLFFILGVVGIVTTSGCGSTTSTTTTTTPTSDTSCAAGDNDFYVVENAACASGEGKLSRVNPDALCKDEILTSLDCPIDFVLSAVDAGIGYLSSRVDGIIQVNVTAKTKTEIPCDNCFTNNAEAIGGPTSLFLMENITSSEKASLCAGISDEDFLATVDAILWIADEGGSDAGSVLSWCLVTSDAASDQASPNTIISTAMLENPRGVAVKDRTTVYATGIVPGTGATLVSRNVDGSGAVSILSTDVSTDVKDIIFDSDGTLLIADPGANAVLRYNETEGTIETLPGFTGGPRDILPIGNNSEGNAEYLVSEFDDNVVSRTTLIEDTEITSATTGITLSGPNGITK